MLITQIVPINFFVYSLIFTFFSLYVLIKLKILKNILDPSIRAMFQIIFTFFILLFLNVLPELEIFSFLLMFLFIAMLNKIRIPTMNLFSVQDWLDFSNTFFYLLLLMNIYLLITKGFILLSPEAASVKVTFYQGYGIFSRFNVIGVLVLGLSSFYYFKHNKLRSIIYILFCSYLMLSSGGKSGLMNFLFLYGAYAYYGKVTINYKKVFFVCLLLFSTVLGMFFIIYKGAFLLALFYRFVSYADGPVYYYYGGFVDYFRYGIDYLFDQLLVNVRILPSLKYTGLGSLINSVYFGFKSALYGPNPQLFVEGRVVFGDYITLYYLMIGSIYILLRKFATTSFSFYAVGMFCVTLFIDAQYGISNLVTLGILYFLLTGHTLTKKMIISTNNKRKHV